MHTLKGQFTQIIYQIKADITYNYSDADSLGGFFWSTAAQKLDLTGQMFNTFLNDNITLN